MDEEYEYEEERSANARRSGLPRFGSFVTIAAAILLLFGAASNVGRVSEFTGLLNIDQAQQRRNQGERLQDERLKTIITLGAVPAPAEELRPRSGGSLPLDHDVLPPRRSEVDPDYVLNNGMRPPAASMVTRDPGRRQVDVRDTPSHTDGLRPGQQTPERQATQRGGSYVVRAGDNWVKIAKNTLGDGSRWQEIHRANPSAKQGLTVGMRLAIP